MSKIDQVHERPLSSTRVSNVYGNTKFSPVEAIGKVESMIATFRGHFSDLGYHEEKPGSISSGVDPTVRFIGSPISVLKPYFLEEKIPRPGVFMRQDCLRTRNVNMMMNDGILPMWGSFFANMGAITPPDRINEGCGEAFALFTKLGVSRDNLRVRISSMDDDLIAACRNHLAPDNLEIDSREMGYYRHKLGIEGVNGRSCNIALRNSDGKGFSDVANLIVISNTLTRLCLEISVGPATSLQQIYGLEHVQDCTPVTGLELVAPRFRRKFEDAIITTTVLFREGLRPSGKRNRNRILKKYALAISYFRLKCGVGIEDLSTIIKRLEGQGLPASALRVADDIISYIRETEARIARSKELTREQKQIKQLISDVTIKYDRKNDTCNPSQNEEGCSHPCYSTGEKHGDPLGKYQDCRPGTF